MKTFIRVQDQYGRGMFQLGAATAGEQFTPDVYDIKQLHSLAERHSNFPNRWTDRKIRDFLMTEIEENYRFAFKNLDQFEEWVLRSEVATLNDNGYRVYKIEATDYCESEYQSVFHIDSVVSTEDITNLFL